MVKDINIHFLYPTMRRKNNDAKKDNVMTALKEWTDEQLDFEIARREIFPPYMLATQRWDYTNAQELQAEFEKTPENHEERGWRWWELCLARRQAVVRPGTLFHRVVRD